MSIYNENMLIRINFLTNIFLKKLLKTIKYNFYRIKIIFIDLFNYIFCVCKNDNSFDLCFLDLFFLNINNVENIERKG